MGLRGRGVGSAGEARFPFSSRTKWNYSEQTHPAPPQPESSWSKAYFESIWCAICSLLKMKGNDFYCTELFTHSHLFKCFLFKASYENIKKKERKEKGNEKRRRKKKREPENKRSPVPLQSILLTGIWFHQRKSQCFCIYCASDYCPQGCVATTLEYKAPFLSVHRKLDT